MYVNRVYLYAFDEVRRVVKTYYLEGDSITIKNIVSTAKWMKETIPLPVVVYAIDNRRNLGKEFFEAMKSPDFTKQIEFAEVVRKEGILV